MDSLSPRYRNDPADGLEPDIRKYLDEHYFSKLAYLDTQNPKLLVVFAGGNAVGKSTLAERITREFHGLRLENDGVKRAILAKHPELVMTDKLHKITWQYTMDLYARLDQLTANGLVIRDAVITWYYDRILPLFEERGYALFIVGYDLSDEKMRELINARGNTLTSTTERFHILIEDQKIHLARFLSHYTPDIVLRDDTVFDHGSVVAALHYKLDALKEKYNNDDTIPYIGRPAASALEAIGVTEASQLKEFTEKDLLDVHGIGPKAIQMLREAGLKVKGE